MQCIVQNYKMTENQVHDLAQIITKAAVVLPKSVFPSSSVVEISDQLGTRQHQI